MPRRPLLALVVLIAVATLGCREPQGTAVTDTPRSLDTLAAAALATLDGRLAIPGLQADVQVLRDEWGVPHIFAQNTDDLFLAQGFVVAQDRLWQMEIWRRTSEGRLAELVGPAALPHDRLWRLMRFRGPIDDAEWSSYHPEGRRIFAAYAAGVNAFIAAATGRLPVEFVLTGITPEPWTAEQLLHRARIGDAIAGARAELRLAQSVARLGVREAGRRAPTMPADVLTVPAGLDVSHHRRRGDRRSTAICTARCRGRRSSRSTAACPAPSPRSTGRAGALARQQQLGNQRPAGGPAPP